MQELTPVQQKIYDALGDMLVNDFEVEREDVRWDGRLYEDYDIDSIDAVDMIVQLRPFIGDKRLTPEDFKSVRTLGDVVTAVARILEAPAA